MIHIKQKSQEKLKSRVAWKWSCAK